MQMESSTCKLIRYRRRILWNCCRKM